MDFDHFDRRSIRLTRYERGFTLLNIAACIVVSGLVIGLGARGYEALGSIQNEKFYDDLVRMENSIYAFYEQNNYWPGDCNRNGVIEFKPQNGIQPSKTEGSFVSEATDYNNTACDLLGRTAESVDAPFSDLRRVKIVESDVPNSVLSKHRNGSFFQIGHGETSLNEKANVIVAYGIPLETAKWIDLHIDGNIEGQQGRFRRWDVADAGSNWPKAEMGKVAIAYYFEKI